MHRQIVYNIKSKFRKVKKISKNKQKSIKSGDPVPRPWIVKYEECLENPLIDNR